MESENRNRQPSSNNKENKDNSSGPRFDCNICLETAKDAVVSRCGHLFCWPCLHQWLQTRPDRQICPVCKAAVSRDTVVPLYSGGSENQQDPRDKVPPRPQAQREEAEEERQQNFMPGFGGHGGFQMSFGLGAFPFFPVFGTTLTFGQPIHPTHQRMPEHPNAQSAQQVFLVIAVLCIVYMLFFV